MLAAICSPTVITGFSAVMGSWKIMEMSLPRTFSSWRFDILSISWPQTRISPFLMTPGGDWIRLRIDSAVEVLPAPVSPTRPSVWPFFRLKEIPLTASTVSSSSS